MDYSFLDPNKIYKTAIVGAWGDMFASYAHVSLISRLTPLKKFDVLYYGYDRYIKDFLELQENINEVTWVEPKNKEEYEEIAKESGNTESKNWITNIFGADSKDIISTHLNSFPKLKEIYIRNFDYKLPETSIEIKENSILFNPYSMQSVPLRGHWRFIPDALEWLLKNTDWNIVMIGQDKYHHVKWGITEFPIFVNHPKLQNLVGKTESMLDVLAIVEKCQGMITTSNCLSMWSIVSQKPTIVMLNSMLADPKRDTSVYYFRKWIECHPNTLLSYWATIADFTEAAETWKLNIGV